MLPNHKSLRRILTCSWAAAAVAISMAKPCEAAEFQLQEATFDQFKAAMDAGALSSVELTVMYLNRIAVYDQGALFLNSTPVINENALAEAAVVDSLRAKGVVLSPIHGLPFSVKDTFNIAGMPTASGSPAFVDLVAKSDAAVVARLREAGAIALGKTNLPPMGNGTNNRSIYGTSKNPYNLAASPEGSSYGSAIAAASNFAAFTFGGDTTGSLRFPASSQSLVTLKGSKALLPNNGTSPLWPHNDVVGPMTRTVNDLAVLLDLLIKDYKAEAGNMEPLFYEAPSTYKPASYKGLLATNAFAGKRIGVPKPYIGADFTGTSNYDIGPRMKSVFDAALAEMQELGATIVQVDWPAFHTNARDNDFGRANDRTSISPTLTAYHVVPEGSPAGTPTLKNRFDTYYIEEFIKSFENPYLWSFGAAGDLIHFDSNTTWMNTRRFIRDGVMLSPLATFDGEPYGKKLVEGFDAWAARDVGSVFADHDLDAVVYPVFNNLAPFPAGEDTNVYPRRGNFGAEASMFGLPTLVVPMGYLADSGVPVGITFLGGSRNTDASLLPLAYSFEQATHHREAPPLTPPLPGETITYKAGVRKLKKGEVKPPVVSIATTSRVTGRGDKARLEIKGTALDASGLAAVRVYVNGRRVSASKAKKWVANVKLSDLAEWMKPGDTELNVIVLAKDSRGNAGAIQKNVKIPAELVTNVIL